ncbi:hypothetical protein Sjap_018159 [Stephania japonica]|uniref:Uncharacterized protein n=1 Tax=Stephania japonica TaxID=461633 RepID=A0AAP0I7F8_9MAGN
MDITAIRYVTQAQARNVPQRSYRERERADDEREEEGREEETSRAREVEEIEDDKRLR